MRQHNHNTDLNTVRFNCKGRWQSILIANGIPEEILNGKHQPCPFCAGKDRFRWTDYENNGGYYCNQCGPGDGISLLKKYNNLTLNETLCVLGKMDTKNLKIETQKSKPDPLIYLRKIYDGLENISVPVTSYLRNRGLHKSRPRRLSRRLYYNPSIAYYEDGIYKRNYECMVGIVKNPSGKLITMHVTYLDNGKKADVKSPKKILTPIEKINGCAIRLYDYNGNLGVCEGIETAIACYELTGIPTWALLNTSGMESFIPPDNVKHITVFSDNDNNFAGQKAAYTLANKMVIKNKLSVDVRIPLADGFDFLDILNAKNKEDKK